MYFIDCQGYIPNTNNIKATLLKNMLKVPRMPVSRPLYTVNRRPNKNEVQKSIKIYLSILSSEFDFD